MHKRKSARHVRAANARWRAAERRAEAEREAGIPDEPLPQDCRLPIPLDLRSWGGPNLIIEPRLGYIAGRAINVETGAVVACAALKTLLHKFADELPRTMGARNFR